MQTQKDISLVHKQNLPRLIEVWEASVCATHLFLSESDIQLFPAISMWGVSINGTENRDKKKILKNQPFSHVYT